MAHSYQEVDSRLKTVEDKIDFVMKSFTVTQRTVHPLDPERVIVTQSDLLSLYRQIKGLGGELETINGEVIKEVKEVKEDSPSTISQTTGDEVI